MSFSFPCALYSITRLFLDCGPRGTIRKGRRCQSGPFSIFIAPLPPGTSLWKIASANFGCGEVGRKKLKGRALRTVLTWQTTLLQSAAGSPVRWNRGQGWQPKQSWSPLLRSHRCPPDCSNGNPADTWNLSVSALAWKLERGQIPPPLTQCTYIQYKMLTPARKKFGRHGHGYNFCTYIPHT